MNAATNGRPGRLRRDLGSAVREIEIEPAIDGRINVVIQRSVRPHPNVPVDDRVGLINLLDGEGPAASLTQDRVIRRASQVNWDREGGRCKPTAEAGDRI